MSTKVIPKTTRQARALTRALGLAGSTQAELAIMIGVRQQAISKWLLDGKIPANRVLQVSRALRWRITPHEFRPDIYPYVDDGMPPRWRSGMAGSTSESADVAP